MAQGHPEALLAALPVPDPARREQRRALLGGDVRSPISPRPGCPFHPRCPIRAARCDTETPARRDVSPGHVVWCHHR